MFVSGAEKNDVVGFNFFENVGLGIVVEIVIIRIGKLWNDNKNSSEE